MVPIRQPAARGDDVFTLDPTDPAADVNVTIDGGTDATDGNPDGTENGDAGDILDLSDQSASVTVDLGTNPETGTVDGLDADGTPDITFAEIEKIITGSGDDTINGGTATGPIDIATGAGNDSIATGSGNDTIDAGTGDDVINAGAGDDSIIASDGDDTLNGGAGIDTLEGGAGADVFIADGTADLILDFDTTTGIGNGATDDNDFVDLSAFYNDTTLAAWNAANPTEQYSNPLAWLKADQANGVLESAGGLQIQNGGTAVAGSGLSDENTGVVCFVAGTRIGTLKGEVEIGALQPGDMIMTMDSGYQPIRWIGSTKVAAVGNLAPIKFRKGTLSNTRDLLVSPQHRMFLSGWQAEILFAENEVLAAAKHLVNDHSVVRVEGGEVEYFHVLFDQHEIIFAEGCPSESFHPGREGWGALSEETRAEILALFPHLSSENFDTYGPSARTTLKAREAQMVIEANYFRDPT